MKRTFSFNEPSVPFILKLLPSVLPGIEKIIFITHSPLTSSLTSHIVRIPGEGMIEEFRISDNVAVMNRFRLETSPYTWLQKSDVPFEISSKEKVQLNIFNEFENNILLIRILNDDDHLNDLLFIYFNSGLGSFGNLNPSKFFSTDNKAIIANLVRNFILTTISNIKEDRQLFSLLGSAHQSVIIQKEEIQEALDQSRKKYQDAVLEICESYLTDLSQQYGKVYSFSETAVNKLLTYQGPFVRLRKIIEASVRQAEIFATEDVKQIIIEDHHLSLTEPQAEVTATKIPSVPARYSKTLTLLDKLETAAVSIKSKNMLLTSANVGNEFSTPVTPPAITDALRKHRQKILHLFGEYPERWEIIRSEFRPIQNILQVKKDLEQLSA